MFTTFQFLYKSKQAPSVVNKVHNCRNSDETGSQFLQLILVGMGLSDTVTMGIARVKNKVHITQEGNAILFQKICMQLTKNKIKICMYLVDKEQNKSNRKHNFKLKCFYMIMIFLITPSLKRRGSKIIFKTRRSILGSDCMSLILIL